VCAWRQKKTVNIANISNVENKEISAVIGTSSHTTSTRILPYKLNQKVDFYLSNLF